MRTSLAILIGVTAVAAPRTSDGEDQKPTFAPAIKRFEEKLLALVRKPGVEKFQSVGDLARMRSDAGASLKSFGANDRISDERLVAEWLASIEPLCDESWRSATTLKQISLKDGVAKSKLRLRNAEGAQVDCLVWTIEKTGDRRFIDIQRLPEGTSAALQTILALGGASANVLADEFRALEAGSKNDPRPMLFRNEELGKEPLRRHRDRLCLEWAGVAARPREVLRDAAELKREGDDAAVAWLSAKANYQLDRRLEASRCLEWYESLAGKDAWSHLLRAKLFKQEGRFADARRECAEALKDDPTSVEAAIELFEVAPPREKDKAAERLPSGSVLNSIAWTLGSTLASAGDVPGLEAVLKHAEKAGSSAKVVAYLRGAHLLAQGKYSEAAKAVDAHLPKVDDDAEDVDDNLDLYCEAMYRQGKPQDAYRRAAATPKKAFSLIADKLDGEKDAAVFEQIAAEHFKLRPNDGAGVEWYARFQFDRKKYVDAGRAVDRFLQRPDAEKSEDVQALRELRVQVFIAEKNITEALKFIGDDEELFEVAAEELADADRGEELTRLVEEFAPNASDVALFTNWKAEAAFLKKDYNLAFALLKAMVDPTLRRPGVELDARRRLLFVRTQLRLGFKTGIDRVAEKVLSPGDDLGFALAYAAASRIEKMEIALENCLEAGLEARELMDDPDLGPLLDSPALSKVRDKVLLDPELNP